MSQIALWRRLLAELLGSAFLTAVVIGSGIAAQRLSPGDTGLELLENAAATAAGLCAIILMFGPGLPRPLPSGRLLRRRCLRGPVLAGCCRLPPGPGPGCFAGGDREPDVRPGRRERVREGPGLARALPVRDRRPPRPGPG